MYEAPIVQLRNCPANLFRYFLYLAICTYSNTMTTNQVQLPFRENPFAATKLVVPYQELEEAPTAAECLSPTTLPQTRK
jgi:hypothetical protein